jgi:hypothetical protein
LDHPKLTALNDFSERDMISESVKWMAYMLDDQQFMNWSPFQALGPSKPSIQ